MRSQALLILCCHVVDFAVAVVAHAMGSDLSRHAGTFLQRDSTQQESIGRLVAGQDVKKSLRITFLHDSQAGTCGLDKTLPAIFEEDGFDTCTRGAGYLCVKKQGGGIPCQPFSSTTWLSEGCSATCSDIYIHWVGINDAKIDNNDAMNLKSDLLFWKQQVRTKCGQHTGLVFVQPPIFQKLDIGGEFTYDIAGLRATMDAAYVAVTEAPCATTRNIGGAIYEAVIRLSSTSNANAAMFTLADPFAERLDSKLESNRLRQETGYNWTNITRGALLVGLSTAPLALGEAGSLLLQRSSLSLELPTTRPWLALFDLVRLLGALHICAFHFFQHVSAVAGYGKYWISVFFFMSGFLATYREQRYSAFQLVMHNLQASYVVYAIALVAMATVVWPPVLVLGQTLTMTQAWLFPCHNDFNGPSWFMSDLLLFWLLTPHWSMLLINRTSAQLGLMLGFCWLATLTPVISCALLRLNPNVEFGNFIEFHPIGRWPVYVGGMVFAQLFLSMSAEYRHKAGLSSFSAGILLLGLVMIGFTTPPGFNLTLASLLWDHGFGTFPMLCGLAYLATQWTPPDACTTLLAWAGRVSLPIYLLHVPVMSMGRYYLGYLSPLSFWCVLAVASLATAAVQRSATSMMRQFTGKQSENALGVRS